MQNFVIKHGFEEHHRIEAAGLFLEAFGPKVAKILGTGPRVNALFADILDPDYALSAVSEGHLLGIAGFKTAQGGFTKGTYTDIARHYGYLGGLLRGLAMNALEREVAADRLLMDGIAVHAEARGRGVGSALLDAMVAQTQNRGLSELRLDVIDSNPKARALYERKGFIAGKTQHLGPLRHVFGFTSSTTMIRQT